MVELSLCNMQKVWGQVTRACRDRWSCVANVVSDSMLGPLFSGMRTQNAEKFGQHSSIVVFQVETWESRSCRYCLGRNTMYLQLSDGVEEVNFLTSTDAQVSTKN